MITINGSLDIKDSNGAIHTIHGQDFDIQYDNEQGEDYTMHQAEYEDPNGDFSVVFDIEERWGKYNGNGGFQTDNCEVVSDNLKVEFVSEEEE